MSALASDELRRNSLTVAFALLQFPPPVLDGGPAINRFAAPDLLQAAGDFLAQLGGVGADEFLLRPQHAEALGHHVAGGLVMAALELLRDELLLFRCQCDRHGTTITSKNQFVQLRKMNH